jgi:hypothetical protein
MLNATLVKWVSSKLNEEGHDEVIDPTLDSKYKEEISKLLNLGFFVQGHFL